MHGHKRHMHGLSGTVITEATGAGGNIQKCEARCKVVKLKHVASTFWCGC